MSSPAFRVFERLDAQVAAIRNVAVREVAGGFHTAPVLYRACIVLMVAAFDSYMHEQGVRLLKAHAASAPGAARQVVSYIGGLSIGEITGPEAEGLIRYRLSYRALVGPPKVDELLSAAGLDADSVWLKVSVALGSRPDRTRLQLQLQYDRRNQIAHEGDWDSIAFDTRAIEPAHVGDCVKCVTELVKQFDVVLP